jgi:hypothetical protein
VAKDFVPPTTLTRRSGMHTLWPTGDAIRAANKPGAGITRHKEKVYAFCL